jgi:hypothetical protein
LNGEAPCGSCQSCGVKLPEKVVLVLPEAVALVVPETVTLVFIEVETPVE